MDEPDFNETQAERFAKLMQALHTCKNVQELERFVIDLMTPGEMVALSERWLLARMLDTGNHTYRDIAKLTGASTTTVGRVARFLTQEPHQGYRVILDRLKKSQKT